MLLDECILLTRHLLKTARRFLAARGGATREAAVTAEESDWALCDSVRDLLLILRRLGCEGSSCLKEPRWDHDADAPLHDAIQDGLELPDVASWQDANGNWFVGVALEYVDPLGTTIRCVGRRWYPPDNGTAVDGPFSGSPTQHAYAASVRGESIECVVPEEDLHHQLEPWRVHR